MNLARPFLLLSFALGLLVPALTRDNEETRPAGEPPAPPHVTNDPAGLSEPAPPAFWLQADDADRPRDASDPFAGVVDPFAPPAAGQDPRHAVIKEEPGPARPLRIRLVTFRIPIELTNTLAGDGPVPGDDVLFHRLGKLADRGEITTVADFDHGGIGGRTVDQQATQEFVHPTEWEPDGERMAMAPTAFETRDIGTMCSLTPGLRHDGVLAAARIERVRYAGFSSWRSISVASSADPPRSCLVQQPLFLTEKVEGVSVLSQRRVQLIAAQPEAMVPGATEVTTAWLYTFMRLDPAGRSDSPAMSAPAAECDAVALELIVIRARRDEAAQWLANRGPGADDAAELAAWEEHPTQERPPIAARWCLRAATGPVRPGGPPKQTVASTGEFIYVSEFEAGSSGPLFVSPTSFETRNCGSSFSAQVTWAADGKSSLVSLGFEDVALEGIEQWTCSPDVPSLSIEQPRFRVRKLSTEITVPVNGVRFVGIREVRASSSADGAEGGRDCELLFLKARGTPRVIAPEARPALPVVEAQTVVFSVPAAMAAQLAHERDERRRVSALWNGQSDRGVEITYLTAGAGCIGGELGNSDFLETIYPTEFDSNGLGRDFLAMTAFETLNHGADLSLRPRLVSGAVIATIGLDWESAPPVRPTWDEYRRFCESGGNETPRPEFYPEQVAAGGTAVPADGEWHILSFRECAAPAATPEHGRWHAAVARVLERK